MFCFTQARNENAEESFCCGCGRQPWSAGTRLPLVILARASSGCHPTSAGNFGAWADDGCQPLRPAAGRLAGMSESDVADPLPFRWPSVLGAPLPTRAIALCGRPCLMLAVEAEESASVLGPVADEGAEGAHGMQNGAEPPE